MAASAKKTHDQKETYKSEAATATSQVALAVKLSH